MLGRPIKSQWLVRFRNDVKPRLTKARLWSSTTADALAHKRLRSLQLSMKVLRSKWRLLTSLPMAPKHQYLGQTSPEPTHRPGDTQRARVRRPEKSEKGPIKTA